MPVYEYKAVKGGCGNCRGGFEALQSFKDEPLKSCPECGAPVKKLQSSFSVGKGNILSNKNLKSHGFTKLRREGKGRYIKEV